GFDWDASFTYTAGCPESYGFSEVGKTIAACPLQTQTQEHKGFTLRLCDGEQSRTKQQKTGFGSLLFLRLSHLRNYAVFSGCPVKGGY
ncbi:MAG: hypothetical protein RR194_05465, partial [Ruthenibacterium sp.]